MDMSEISNAPAPGEQPTVVSEPTLPVGVAQAADTYRRCDDCDAAVDTGQRYCVVCGAHLKQVNDPASRHFSKATVRSKAVRAAATVPGSTRGAGRGHGLGTALVLALIPIAAAVGVMVGRSSNNDDAKLIQELSRRPATVAAATTTTAAATAHAAVRGRHATRADRPKHNRATNGSPTHGSGKVISTTTNGSVQQITGFKPTKSEEQQGAKATQQVQKSTGKSYVNSQSSLPSQVVVP